MTEEQKAKCLLEALRLTKTREVQPMSGSAYQQHYGPTVLSTTIWTDQEIEELKQQLTRLINQ